MGEGAMATQKKWRSLPPMIGQMKVGCCMLQVYSSVVRQVYSSLVVRQVTQCAGTHVKERRATASPGRCKGEEVVVHII